MVTIEQKIKLQELRHKVQERCRFDFRTLSSVEISTLLSVFFPTYRSYYIPMLIREDLNTMPLFSAIYKWLDFNNDLSSKEPDAFIRLSEYYLDKET